MPFRNRGDAGRQLAADPAGRIVIVVDDGIATGASMLAALAPPPSLGGTSGGRP
jgi:predicted phosphoribosyltransferase